MFAFKALIFSLSAFLLVTSIGFADEVPSPRPGFFLYRVQRGDHIAQILRVQGFKDLWGVHGKVNQVIQINHLEKPNQLEAGTWLYIPAPGVPIASPENKAEVSVTKEEAPLPAAV